MNSHLTTHKFTSLCLFVSVFALTGMATGQDLQEAPGAVDLPEFVSRNTEQSWFGPWVHSHFSQRGTPFVHTFNLEPAFLGRDFFLSYFSTKGSAMREAELEAELEWAFTHRLGMVLEAPFVQLSPVGAKGDSGIGDVATAVRALFIEGETFLFAGNLELSFPTGD
jgi:hypothetical protein